MNHDEQILKKYSIGKLRIHEYYLRGVLNGEHKTWDMNGLLQTRKFYQNGSLNGRHQEWYENKQPCIDQYYRNGTLEGERRLWHSDGREISYVYRIRGITIDKKFTSRKKQGFISYKSKLSNIITRKNIILLNLLIPDLIGTIIPFF